VTLKIKRTPEFQARLIESYNKTKSCGKTATQLANTYGFKVSGYYVAKVLRDNGIEISYPNRSIYDVQIKR
jgi:alanyl-tRNA synthetase